MTTPRLSDTGRQRMACARAFSTGAREQTDFAHEVIEASLAHSVGSAVVRAYARTTFFDRRRALLEAWAGFLGSGKVKAIGVGPAAREDAVAATVPALE